MLSPFSHAWNSTESDASANTAVSLINSETHNSSSDPVLTNSEEQKLFMTFAPIGSFAEVK